MTRNKNKTNLILCLFRSSCICLDKLILNSTYNSFGCADAVVAELLDRGPRVNVDDILLLWAVIEEVLHKVRNLRCDIISWWLVTESSHFVLGLSIVVSAIGASLLLVVAHLSFLGDDLCLQNEVILLLDALHIKDLEGTEDETEIEHEHVTDQVEIVHARQPVVVDQGVLPVE